jgi:hypothetical protein
MKKFVMNSLGSITEIEDEEPQMDLRDYFAAKAMKLCYQFWIKDYYDLGFSDPEEKRDGFLPNMVLIAETAYEMADEMIKARKL